MVYLPIVSTVLPEKPLLLNSDPLYPLQHLSPGLLFSFLQLSNSCAIQEVILALFHYFTPFFWPCLACPPSCSGLKRSSHHLTLDTRGQFIALSHDPSFIGYCFLVDSEKDWKTVFKLGGRRVDLLWADSNGTDILGSAPPSSPLGKMG